MCYGVVRLCSPEIQKQVSRTVSWWRKRLCAVNFSQQEKKRQAETMQCRFCSFFVVGILLLCLHLSFAYLIHFNPFLFPNPPRTIHPANTGPPRGPSLAPPAGPWPVYGVACTCNANDDTIHLISFHHGCSPVFLNLISITHLQNLLHRAGWHSTSANGLQCAHHVSHL
jgi:hypothetical protein